MLFYIVDYPKLRFSVRPNDLKFFKQDLEDENLEGFFVCEAQICQFPSIHEGSWGILIYHPGSSLVIDRLKRMRDEILRIKSPASSENLHN